MVDKETIMRMFDVQAIEIAAPRRTVFEFLAQPGNLPLWAHAFVSAGSGRARLSTPNGAVDVGLVLMVARFWFEIPLRGSLFLLLGLSGLFVLTTLGLGLFVSTISRTQQQAMMTAQFFFYMPFLFLSGFAFPTENMPPVIQAITYVIPLRYFITIIRGIYMKGAGIAELWHEALALLMFGFLILSLSVMRFRKRLT